MAGAVANRGVRLWARRIAAAAAIGYLAALVLIVLLLHTVGERWWATGVGLYLPRLGFALPLPFVVALLLLFGPRELLYSQLAALLIVVFPLMGFVVSVPTSRGEPSLRVLSFNVNSAYFGVDVVVDAITSYSPDVVLIQEIFDNGNELEAALKPHFPTVLRSTQFIVATKYAVDSTVEPGKLPHEGRARSPRFIRYTAKTALGEVVLYNVHPISPRYGMYAIRGKGFRRELLTGRFFKAENTDEMQGDSELRKSQVEAFARSAAAETGTVIIGGDTNLPTLSPILSNLSPFVEGFPSTGFGFGYTFPAKLPWMRIDRILTSRDLTFTSFTVGCKGASDHLCVVADVRRR